MTTPANKIQLYGFNNLTKHLSFSFYKCHYLTACDTETLRCYHDFIQQNYGADKLEQLLTKVCHAIGGNILNVAKQNYQPQGASVTLMISEESPPTSLVAHLDKSHLCVHTYPDTQITNNVAIFRADIELSTCGVISPLNVLDYLIETLAPDLVDIDYRIRGMTRDQQGNKLFSDETITTITEHLSPSIEKNYQIKNSPLIDNNLFYAQLQRHNLHFQKMVFGPSPLPIFTENKAAILQCLKKEINELAAPHKI